MACPGGLCNALQVKKTSHQRVVLEEGGQELVTVQSVAGKRDAHLASAVAAHTAWVIWEESSKTSTPWQQSDAHLPLASRKLEQPAACPTGTEI